jgi:hypothetical protein
MLARDGEDAEEGVDGITKAVGLVAALWARDRGARARGAVGFIALAEEEERETGTKTEETGGMKAAPVAAE